MFVDVIQGLLKIQLVCISFCPVIGQTAHTLGAFMALRLKNGVKNKGFALACMALWLECWPVHGESWVPFLVKGHVPGGTNLSLLAPWSLI